jgi:uncharacterized protein (TIRG00374 family)
METVKKPLHSNIVLIILILGLVAFLLYIFFFVNPAQIVETLNKTNLAIYATAFVAFGLSTFFSSLVWNSLLNNLSVKISKRRTFLFTWVGLFFDATVPQLGWSAEISKTYLLAKDVKVEAGRIVASVVGQKIFTMTIVITALSTGLVLVLLNYALPIASILLIGLVLTLSILTLAVVYYVSFKPTATKKLLNFAIKIALFFRKSWNPQNFKNKADETLHNFHSGFKQLRSNPKRLIQPIGYAVTAFFFEVSVVFLTFLALGQPVPIDVVLIVFTITGTLQTVGVAIFGFPELIMTLTFTALFIEPAVAVSVALLTRVVNLWFRLFVSYIALQWAGIKILRKTS